MIVIVSFRVVISAIVKTTIRAVVRAVARAVAGAIFRAIIKIVIRAIIRDVIRACQSVAAPAAADRLRSRRCCLIIAFNPVRNLTSPCPYQSMLHRGRLALQIARHVQL